MLKEHKPETEFLTAEHIKIADFVYNERNQVPQSHQRLIDDYINGDNQGVYLATYFFEIGYTREQLRQMVRKEKIKIPNSRKPKERADFYWQVVELLTEMSFEPTTNTATVRQVQHKNGNNKKKKWNAKQSNNNNNNNGKKDKKSY